jgi:hypothetical protein
MSFGLPGHLRPYSVATNKGDHRKSRTVVLTYAKHSGISNNHHTLCSGLLYHIKNRLKKLPKNKMSFDNPPGKLHTKNKNYTNKKFKILTLMFLINPSPDIRN